MSCSLDAFLAEHRNTRLLVMQGDTIHAERYQYEGNAEHRFAPMSMAKTVIGILLGIALHEKEIKSLDDKAEVYVPDLKGYCCLSATLRDWARLGLLLASGGARNGKQIIPAAWVKAATARRHRAPPTATKPVPRENTLSPRSTT